MRVPKTYVRRLLTSTAVMLLVLAGAPAALTQSEATATAVVATADKAVTPAENARVPQGAAWTQHYFPSSNRFFVWSEPLEQSVRNTGTPQVSLSVEGYGNVMVELYDVAPEGSAVAFNRQVAVVKPGTTSFDLRSTDWTLQAGHALAVEIGTIQPSLAPDNDWIDTPSFETITVSDARLELALDDPANDTVISDDRAPWLDIYRQGYTEQLSPGAPSFTLPPEDR